MEILLQPESWIALLTLTFLEIVLGIDNIIFISIVVNKLSPQQQQPARITGLALAMIFRVLLLIGITYIISFSKPLLEILDFQLSIRDLILFSGGLFLIYKSVMEIHHKIEGDIHTTEKNLHTGFAGTILQIVLLDLVFSFDSILTAVGLTKQLHIMIIAVIIAICIMMIFAKSISEFINRFPTLQILALSFLLLIGFMLITEGFHYEVPKGYIYFAVFFSLFVELININVRKKTEVSDLHK